MRLKTPKDIETNVLVRSRRRCCICYGLNRDTALKNGQIAHLDRVSSNGSEDNLAFLCFHHHDKYDSRVSQRKGFTLSEVKSFRSELHVDINKAFSQASYFGEVQTPPADPYAGQYTRIGSEHDSAEITLTPLPIILDGRPRYFVSGLALWGIKREYGPRLGTLEFEALMEEERVLMYARSKLGNAEDVAITRLSFDGQGAVSVSEHNVLGEYGMNVFFDGIYKKST